jgi:Fur family ferric uptake transcriptional regulator
MTKILAKSEDWKQTLRSLGLRATSSTIATLNCLESAEQALSHEDLYQQLDEQTPDRVTLYRILERLMQAGLVQRYTDSARVQRFALSQRSSVGVFECDNCHNVIPIEQDPALETAIEMVKKHLTCHGMAEREITLSSHGICSDCNPSFTK